MNNIFDCPICSQHMYDVRSPCMEDESSDYILYCPNCGYYKEIKEEESMREYVRGERLRKFCEKNALTVKSTFDEEKNKYIFNFEPSWANNHPYEFEFFIEVDGTRYIAKGEQAEIALVQIAQRKLNQILTPKKEKWYE